LWPKVKKLEERKDIGRALSMTEQRQLLDGLDSLHSQTLRTLIPTLLLTGMRSGEATSLRWMQVDLMVKTITVGRAKTSSGTGRLIPFNDELGHVLAAHRAWFVDHFGEPEPEHCVFPFGHPVPSDPSRHITDIKWAWTKLRKITGVRCRLHDLRHTFATGLAERGVPESTMLALMGHMSRAMLERYSHIRMTAKREAVAGATLRPPRENSDTVSTISTTVEVTPRLQ
jgi:integrase